MRWQGVLLKSVANLPKIDNPKLWWVEAHIVIPEGMDALKIPTARLFAGAKAEPSSLSTTDWQASAPSLSVIETKPSQKFSVELESAKT